MDKLERLLHDKIGFKSFRTGQRDIIQSVLERKDVVAIIPTGGGKTLCYQFPSKLIDGITIIVSPLLSLMEDQVHQLRAYGDKSAVQINSLLSFEERTRVLKELTNQSMLFISPEMLGNEYIKKRLKSLPVGLFVVDEAHCISQWGHEFRTDYLRLKEVRALLGSPPCLALTATATPQVEKDIIMELGMKNPTIHRFSVNRKNIRMNINQAENTKEKEENFFEFLSTVEHPGIIYTATRNDALRLSEKMNVMGFNAAFYHGGMTKEDRILVQYQFLNNEIPFICATNAFGMGVNKQNIRTVIHMHLPSSIEQYVQEIGRAGRDGMESIATLFFSKEDQTLPRRFIEMEYPTDKELQLWLIDGLSFYRKEDSIQANWLKDFFQIDDVRWRMLRYYLEKSGIIHADLLLMNKINSQYVNRLSAFFMNRKNKKELCLDRFVKLVKGNQCIRQGILSYFGESYTFEQEACCSVCGYLEEKWEKKKKPIQRMEYISWQEQLQKMLLPQWTER
ncbi:RecQ family ATP-dependent DNA helicase [Evansella tamaricis]|uniref:ATP-dependent DNA helicase n=1 Tax=Evansella tamaricis TaxID=2069301 RepID=A0ABS6JPP1_9BACI|nr:ATP-dependent DNA helicase RecQ [Evansella tamaricis]MBU9714278.1 ATP-dependent DNA helicase [Evansella tamaricis]